MIHTEMTMGYQIEIALIFDTWMKTLPFEEREACSRAIKNAMTRLENIGDLSAKELVIALLLFCDGKFPQPPPAK